MSKRNLWFSLYWIPPWSGSARCQHANRVTGSTLRVRRSTETVAVQAASESSRTVFLRPAQDGLVLFRCCLNSSAHLSVFCCCLSLSQVDNKENEVGKSPSSARHFEILIKVHQLPHYYSKICPACVTKKGNFDRMDHLLNDVFGFFCIFSLFHVISSCNFQQDRPGRREESGHYILFRVIIIISTIFVIIAAVIFMSTITVVIFTTVTAAGRYLWSPRVCL